MVRQRLVAALLWGVAGLVLYVGAVAATLPHIEDALDRTRRPSMVVLAENGVEIAAYGDRFGRLVHARELPDHMIDALLAIEDRRFFDHFGLDLRGIARAAVANLRHGGAVQGGSTITQQLAKTLFLSPERTLHRKLREALLAIELEARFDKAEILTMYLNRVYFGVGTFGVDAAARRYFGRSAVDVSVLQAAILAGSLKAPSRLSPAVDPKAALERAHVVLDAMVASDRLAPERAADLKRAPAVDARRSGTGLDFANWVAEELRDRYAGGGDLVLSTTLDPDLQSAAERILTARLKGAAPDLQGAAVAMSTETGAVRAMVGGRGDLPRGFNRAVQAFRQPGSAFKPVVYLTALEAGYQPEDRVIDGPVTLDGWSPENAGGGYLGEMSLADALAASVNTVPARLVGELGPDRVRKVAARLGLHRRLRSVPALALGAGEVRLIDLTAAFAAIGNGGRAIFPHGLIAARDKDGRVLFARTGQGAGRAMSPATAQALSAMLEGAIAHGTGRAARLPFTAAGKTGTSQDNRDGWFVGYAGGLAVGVWVGRDDDRPVTGLSGGGLPAEIWHDIMLAAQPLRVTGAGSAGGS